MSRLRTLPPRLTPAPSRLKVQGTTTKALRLTGRKLQARRLRLWAANPYCVRCGKLTVYPHGFELDHKLALTNGGQDTDDNCQVLCSGPAGCHASKTAEDMGRATIA